MYFVDKHAYISSSLNSTSIFDEPDSPDDAQASSSGAEHKKPSRLKLAFSKAADTQRVLNVLKSDVKGELDPNNYVANRDLSQLEETIDNGSAVFLYDPDEMSDDDIQTLTLVYPTYKDKHDRDEGETHDYGELGSLISRLPGFASGGYVVSAILLREWWENQPKESVITEIKASNIASLKTAAATGWEEIHDEDVKEELDHLCNDDLDYDSSGASHWFKVTDKSIEICAKAILSTLVADENGHKDLSLAQIFNKKSGEVLPMDLSALEDIGLSYERLEAIANGNTDKQALQQIPLKPKP